MKAVARHCSTGSSLLGQGTLQNAEVEQLLEYCSTQVMSCLNEAAEIKEKLSVRICQCCTYIQKEVIKICNSNQI